MKVLRTANPRVYHRILRLALLALLCPTAAFSKTFNCDDSRYILSCFKAYEVGILPSHKAKLNRIVHEVRLSTKKLTALNRITVIGHSAYYRASDPAEEMALQRAHQVKDYLRQALDNSGLNGVTIIVGGVGVREPITTNSTVHGRNINRRVEVFLRSNKFARQRLKRARASCKAKNTFSRVANVNGKTCYSNLHAKALCNQHADLGYNEKITFAACRPLVTQCVICEEG